MSDYRCRARNPAEGKRGEVKPLVPLLGVPLIERVIRSAIAGGVDEFYVIIKGDATLLFL